jgi:Uma2 family endonuclease
MSAEPDRKYTLDEYLELDRSADARYEYWNGEIFSMSGASESHDQINVNLIVSLRPKLREQSCRVFSADMHLLVPAAPPYRYADLSIVCAQPVFEKIGGVDALKNGVLIVEILSETTEAYNRGDKFTYYKSIDTFREYLLVAQHRPHVTQYVRQEDKSWSYREINDISAGLTLPSVACELSLIEIYQDVHFPPAPPLNMPTPG